MDLLACQYCGMVFAAIVVGDNHSHCGIIDALVADPTAPEVVDSTDDASVDDASTTETSTTEAPAEPTTEAPPAEATTEAPVEATEGN